MTGRDLLTLAATHVLALVLVLAVPPVVALVAGLMHPRGVGGQPPWRYVYAVLVYLACVPGTLAAVLVAYTVLFTGESLLEVPLLVYVLPIVTMVLTLMLMRRTVSFQEVPGFDRLSGLIVLIAATFVIVFALSRTRIWLVFGGSIAKLGALCVALFAVLKWGAATAFRRGDEPRPEPPSLRVP